MTTTSYPELGKYARRAMSATDDAGLHLLAGELCEIVRASPRAHASIGGLIIPASLRDRIEDAEGELIPPHDGLVDREKVRAFIAQARAELDAFRVRYPQL